MGMLRLIAMATFLSAAPAVADPPTIAPEHRLTPAEIEATLVAAAERQLAAERATGMAPVDVLDPLPRGAASPLDLHGSFGVSVGTHGYRSAYGTAVVGLGGTSSVAISIERSEGDRQRWIVP